MDSREEVARKALEIRKGLEKKSSNQGFPYMGNIIGASRLHDKLDCLIVEGYYLGNNSRSSQVKKRFKYSSKEFNGNFLGISHPFGYHPFSKLFIDIAFDRFNKNNPQTIIFPDFPGVVYSERDIDTNTIYYAQRFHILDGKGMTHSPSSDLVPERYRSQIRRAAA